MGTEQMSQHIELDFIYMAMHLSIIQDLRTLAQMDLTESLMESDPFCRLRGV